MNDLARSEGSIILVWHYAKALGKISILSEANLCSQAQHGKRSKILEC